MEPVEPFMTIGLVWNGTLIVNISLLRSPIIAVTAAVLAGGVSTLMKYLWRLSVVLATSAFDFLRFN
jgi:hypothetical protein